MVDNGPRGSKPSVAVPPDHIEAVRSTHSIEQRIIIARKEAARLMQDDLSEADCHLLRHVLHVIALDAEVRVRQALADTLADNPLAPHDIVLALAKDENLVASPLLRLSEVLTPGDLVALIESQITDAKMSAIADRNIVPAPVCLALVEHCSGDTVTRLLRNHGADIPERGLNRIVDRHGGREDVQVALINRDALPATVVERVVALVSAELLTRLVERHRLPIKAAAKVVLETRDRATFGLTPGLSCGTLTDLVEHLIAEHRLTYSLLLRSLCVGNIEIIIHAIAVRSRLSTAYVWSRLVQSSEEGLRDLWRGGDLPIKLLPLAKVATKVLVESERDGANWDVAHYRRRIVERIITEDLDVEFDDDDIAYLEATRDHSAAGRQGFVSGAAHA